MFIHHCAELVVRRLFLRATGDLISEECAELSVFLVRVQDLDLGKVSET